MYPRTLSAMEQLKMELRKSGDKVTLSDVFEEAIWALMEKKGLTGLATSPASLRSISPLFVCQWLMHSHQFCSAYNHTIIYSYNHNFV